MSESRPHGITRVRTLLGMLCLACGLLFFPASAFSATGDVISSFPTPGTSPSGLAWHDTILWLDDSDTDLIYQLEEPIPLVLPSLTVIKYATTLKDPFIGTTDPKVIPRAIVLYTIQVTNFGTDPADANRVTTTDPIPASQSLRITDYDGARANLGPVAFVDGSPSSGLSYTFTSLGSSADDVEFSNDGGSTWTYTPVDSGDGTDPAVTDIRVSLKGIFAGSTDSDNPSFKLRFKAVIQ